LLVSHSDISGILSKDLQPLNILSMKHKFIGLHLDISGNVVKLMEEQFLNKLLIFDTLLIFHLDISGIDIKAVHPLNISFISVT